jgi:hypothetical protein
LANFFEISKFELLKPPKHKDGFGGYFFNFWILEM